MTRAVLGGDSAETCGGSAVAALVGVVQFSDKVVVSVGATTGGRAMLGLTVSTCSASVLGWLLEEFHDFLREGVRSDPEVDYVLLFSDVATLVVNNGSGRYCTGFAGIDAPRAVFPTLVGMLRRRSMHSRYASAAEQFYLEIWTVFLQAPCILQSFSAVRILGEWIFWSSRALTAVSARGLRGCRSRREFYSKVTRHTRCNLCITDRPCALWPYTCTLPARV